MLRGPMTRAGRSSASRKREDPTRSSSWPTRRIKKPGSLASGSITPTRSRRTHGLTLQFSGPIAIAGLQDPDNPVLTLVDQDGQGWPITLVRYDANLGQLSLVFNQSLPSGTYRLLESTSGGLVDLAGTKPDRHGPVSDDTGLVHIRPAGGHRRRPRANLPGVSGSGLVATVVVKSGRPTIEHSSSWTGGLCLWRVGRGEQRQLFRPGREGKHPGVRPRDLGREDDRTSRSNPGSTGSY